MAARKSAIEFLPQEEWEQTTLGKVLRWILTIGRHIVIITELIVISAFLFRFKLDRDLSNLNEAIKQKQAIITSSVEFEKDFRFLQKRLETIAELRKDQFQSDKILEELASLIPIDVYLNSFNLGEKQITLAATALSEAGLATFLRNLKNSANFKDLTLSQIGVETGREIGIKFQMEGKLVSLNN